MSEISKRIVDRLEGFATKLEQSGLEGEKYIDKVQKSLALKGVNVTKASLIEPEALVTEREVTVTKLEQPKKFVCCEDISNKVTYYVAADKCVTVCQKCNRRHFRFHAEPATMVIAAGPDHKLA